MARRRLGKTGVRALARSSGLAEAVALLAASPYGRHVHPDDSLAEAQHGVLEALLWNLRVLAGWLPPPGVRALRVLAGWFEIANIEEHLARLTGRDGDAPYRLGVLGSAWPRLAQAGSAAELRSQLSASVWGDPGGETAADIALGLRIAWAQRIGSQVGPAVPWVLGGLALMVAGQRYAAGRPLTDRAARGVDALLGREWAQAGDIAGFPHRLPTRARWALRGVERPEQLWRAEAAWWARLRADGLRLLGGEFGPDRPIGTVALLAVDAWQVRAALAVAARPNATEADFDVVA